MTLQTVGLAAALTLVSVLVLLRLRTRLSSGGLMLAAVPLAMVPAAVFVTLAAWRLRWMFEEIGTTGSGGMAAVLSQLEDSGALMLTGVAGILLVLAVAGALALWTRGAVPTSGRPLRGAAAALVVCGLAGVGAAATVVHSTERVVFDAAWMARPLDGGPAPVYPSMAARPADFSLARFGRLVQVSTVGGLALVIGMALVCAMSWAFAPRVVASSRVTAGAWSIAGGLMIAAGVYAWRLGGALSRLDDIVR